MGILFHQETKTFHLYNKEVSYIIRIMENGRWKICITERPSGTGRISRIFMKKCPVR